jgi:hydroxyacylglutathione hydrolase
MTRATTGRTSAGSTHPWKSATGRLIAWVTAGQHGGHPAALYSTFSQQLATLPETTRIYPGHEYIVNNLCFTLDREPNNVQAASLLQKVKHQDPAHAFISTLALEKEINTFFRLRSPTLIKKLREAFPELPPDPDPKTVFLKLRELRNKW